MAKVKRNPGINWGTPIQGQNPRQQARFLLLVEHAAAIRRGFSVDCSLVTNPVTRAVLEVAGVPLETLDPGCGFNYPIQLDAVLRTPWKENRRHPHYEVMDATKGALFSFSLSLHSWQRKNDDWSSSGHEETASQQVKYLHDGQIPSVTLAYRHLIPDYAKAMVSGGGDLKRAGLWFGVDDLATINDAVVPVIARLDAEVQAIRDRRRAEYRERFGHQPSSNNDDARRREEDYAAFGMSMEEWFCKKMGVHFRPGSSGAGLGAASPALPADYRALGISPGASQEEIQAAFRRLAKQHHPDAGGDAERFQAVADAYSRLREVAA